MRNGLDTRKSGSEKLRDVELVEIMQVQESVRRTQPDVEEMPIGGNWRKYEKVC